MTGQQLYARPQSWAELAAATRDEAAYIAGGTEIIPLMRAGIVCPSAIIDLRGVIGSEVELQAQVLTIGGLARLSDVATHPQVRASAPAVVQSLLAGASAQIRNMATVGAISSSARAAAISAIRPFLATKGYWAQVAPRSPGRAKMVRCLARAPNAPLCMRPTLQWRCPPWMPPSASGLLTGGCALFPSMTFIRCPAIGPTSKRRLNRGR